MIASATFGPIPVTLSSALEELALVGVGEPVQLHDVLAYVEVRLEP